jgi:hypothetical protein
MSGNAYRSLFGLVFLAGLTFGIFTASAFSWNVPDDTNVNSRYTVERIELSGVPESKLSASLRKELQQRVGEKFSPEAFAKLAGRVREEVRARLVAPKLLRGSSSEQIRVVFEVSGRRLDLLAKPSRLTYHTAQGWAGDLTMQLGGAHIGIVSDGDEYVERVSGIKAGYSHGFWQDRIRPGFEWQSMRSQFHRSTLDRTPEPYRGFELFQPEVTFTPWRGADREEISFSSGLRLQRFTNPSPGVNREASHALVNTLRYRRVWGEESTGESSTHAEYRLRTGLAGLGSDYRFTRHEAEAGLDWRRGRHLVLLRAQGGTINGDAPLFDRFAYGNATTLRGWNKFQLAPLGANKAIASTLEAGTRVWRQTMLTAFFDSGAVWNQNGAGAVRNSTGLGLRAKNGFFLYLAVPLRANPVEVVLITGAYF